jgi:putative sigma-54 modulation protein
VPFLHAVQFLGRLDFPSGQSTRPRRLLMRLDMTFRNMKTSETLRVRAEKKFHKVATHLREPIEGKLVLSKGKAGHSVELTVSGAGDAPIAVRDEHEDAYTSIDRAFTVMERRARRNRERSLDRAQTGPAKDDVTEEIPI